MFFCVVEHNRQHKRTCVLLEGHPLIGEQNSRALFDPYAMMIVLHKFPRLFARANRYGLIRVDLIEVRWAGHQSILANI